MDHLWTYMWMPTLPDSTFAGCTSVPNRNIKGFLYVDRQIYDSQGNPAESPCVGAAPDLNMLIAPAFAWLYKETGDAKYRDRGDQIFGGGVQHAWLDNGKQFNQNYRWSFDYIRLRPPSDPTPPVVTLIRPINGTVKARAMTRMGATATDNVGVARVEFFVDGKLMCTDKVAAYICDWQVPATVGQTYRLTAKAYDARNNFGSSAVVTVKAVP